MRPNRPVSPSRVILLLTAALLAAITAAPALSEQVESPVTCIEQPSEQGISYGDHTEGCEINPGSEFDLFGFPGVAGDPIRINLLSTSYYFDPQVDLYGPSGLVDSAWCDGGGSPTMCSLTLEAVLPESGDYVIVVSDVGANEPGSYTLQLERIPPLYDPPMLAYDSVETDQIAPETDVDFFTFEGALDTDIRVNVLSTSYYFDPRLEIRDPSGTLIVDQLCSGGGSPAQCSFSVDLSPSIAGTYEVSLSDAGTNESGSYEISLFCLHGECDSDGDGSPDPEPPLVSHVSATTGTISPQAEGDFFRMEALAGARHRINLRSTSYYFDPHLEVRDPDGVLVVDELCSGGGSPTQCSFTVEPGSTTEGTYRIAIYDEGTNEEGSYEFSVICLEGPCDSDADGLLDPTPIGLLYGATVTDEVNPPTEVAQYVIHGTAGTSAMLNLVSLSYYFDPRLEIEHPDGSILVDDSCSGGGSPTKCSISMIPIDFDVDGDYLVRVSDVGTNEAGSFELTLQCWFTGCVDPAPRSNEGDNCVEFANSSLVPDAGGNVQLDTDMDGFGNGCDADLNNDGVVGAPDYNIWSVTFGSQVGDANWNPDCDMNGDGVVGAPDFNLFRPFFGGLPGPSGLGCAGTVPCP